MVVVKITEQTTLAAQMGVAFSLPWEGVTEEGEGTSTATCEHHVVVVRISVEVAQHQISSAVNEGSGQFAAWTPTAVRVGVKMAGKVGCVVYKLSRRVQCGSSMIQICDTCVYTYMYTYTYMCI